MPTTRVMQQFALVLVASGASAAAAGAASLTAFVQFIVSGVSVVNPIGLAPLTVSAEWVVSGGSGTVTYAWAFASPVSSFTTSSVSMLFPGAGGLVFGQRVGSATVADATSTVASSFLLHPRAVTVPAVFDGNVVIESQAKRRIVPT
jgi:hypothetical protein